MILSESPGQGFKITNIVSFSKGFIISGEQGKLIVYEKSEEVKNPYFQLAQLPVVQHKAGYEDANIKRTGTFNPKLMSAVMRSTIQSMSLSSNEDIIIFATENNQIIKTNINLEKKCEES